MKLQNFFKEKTLLTKKKQLTEWEKIFANNTFDKGLLLKIHKNQKNSRNSTDQIIQFKKGGGIDSKRILNQGISIGRKIFKEMFNIINH